MITFDTSEHIAKTMADLVTPRQIMAIRAISNAQRVNSETECQQLFGCRPEELTRPAASMFIDFLKSLPHPGTAEFETRQKGAA